MTQAARASDITGSGYNYRKGKVGLIAPVELFSAPLIKTKLFAPQLRAGLVARPHLLGQLEESALSAIMLVCAPVGYGKATFLTNWIDKLKKPPRPDNAKAASSLLN
jgi:hypothetical protein